MTPNVLMVFPRFNQNSFWSLQAACDMYGACCPAPPLGLITLAALVDRNAEALEPTFDGISGGHSSTLRATIRPRYRWS